MKITKETKRIRAAIKRSGLSLAEFAGLTGLTRMTMHRYRAGVRIPDVAWLERIERLAAEKRK